MKAKEVDNKKLVFCQHKKCGFSFMFYYCFFLFVVVCSGCASIKYEKVSNLEKRTTDFSRYSVSYDTGFLEGYDSVLDVKLNSGIENSLTKQNRFRSVKNRKYGEADIHISYLFDLYRKNYNGPSAPPWYTNDVAYVVNVCTLWMIPLETQKGEVRSFITISYRGRTQRFELMDRYKYWLSLPSLIVGLSSGSLSTYSKLSRLLVARTIEVMEASDLFEPSEKWEPVPATISPEMIVDLHSQIPKAKSRKRTAVAVIIGNSKYQKSGIPDVTYAVSDANLIAKYLQVSMGFQPENIIYLENATLSDFRTIFGDEKNPNARLSSYIQDENSEVFIYYQGHGAPNLSDQSAYLVPVDADPDRIAFSGYSIDLLYNNLSKLNLKSCTLVLDACFSGASGDGKMLIKSASPVFIHVDAPKKVLPNGVIITASSESQIASWFNEAKHSILTYQFLVGLRGEADLDDDGTITLKEMKSYLQNRRMGVPYLANRLYGREQMPQVWGDESRVILTK